MFAQNHIPIDHRIDCLSITKNTKISGRVASLIKDDNLDRDSYDEQLFAILDDLISVSRSFYEMYGGCTNDDLLCELYLTVTDDRNFVVEYQDTQTQTEYDWRRKVVINNILTEILTSDNKKYIKEMIMCLETSNIAHNRPIYYNMYRYLVEDHLLSQYEMDTNTQKFIMQRIIDTYVVHLTGFKFVHGYNVKDDITRLLKTLRDSFGGNIDNVFGEDLPINRNMLINKTDHVFDAVQLVPILTIIGCADTVRLLLKHDPQGRNPEYIKALIKIASRYINKNTCDVLINILKDIEDEIDRNKTINHVIIDIPQDELMDNDDEEIELNDPYFDVTLFCIAVRIYYDTDIELPVFCTIL
jgi:hypothetical protein